MTQINTEKAVAYAVEVPDVVLTTEKAVLYAVEMTPLFLETQKAVLYAAELLDASGNLKQLTPASRPIYKTGVRPYIQFDVGTSLGVTVAVNDEYTQIIYKADATFDVQFLTLTIGLYTIPTINFNQYYLSRGRLSENLIRQIKLSMENRD